jgi:hypothetical protein
MTAPILVPHDNSSNLVRTVESLSASIPEQDGTVVHVVNTSNGFELYLGGELRILDLTCRSGPFKSFSGYELPQNLPNITGFGVPFFAVERKIEEGEGVVYILTREGRDRDVLKKAAEYQRLLAELA